VLRVTNTGATPHNLVVQGAGLETPMLPSGERAELDLAGLADGEYTVICAVAGHETAGMTGTLTVGGSGGVAAATPASHSGHAGAATMTPEEMDEVMAAVTHAFPAATEGKGAQELAPTILPDGTKQFDLTTSIVDWEIEPGKFVEGWAYNGQIPGPVLRAETGDRVRVVLHNELPESTAIHWHGIIVPNEMDGVPDITQPPVKPGESFTYEFTAQGPAVGMYHSHHNSAKQVSNGLAGAILIDRIPVPGDVPIAVEHTMMLNDAGTIGYSLNGKSFPATEPIVVEQGDNVLVHYLNEGLQSHPMHLHGMAGLVVAKDGFPLEVPYMADTLNVAPGERYSVLVTADLPGTWAWHCHILTHAESEDGMFGMVTAMVVQ
jgi:FtsP/CotA-like multicopper oxidase with cupredoxin domain